MKNYQSGLIKIQHCKIVLAKVIQAAMARDVARKARENVQEERTMN